MPLTTRRHGAPFAPPNQLLTSNCASNSHPNPTRLTTKPILFAQWLIPLPLPEAFPITPTPFNLHNSLPTGGFLQTAVSDAPRTTSRSYLRPWNGARPIQHFYEKVIKVKADVAALLFLFFVAFATISTETFALGSLRSDDWQLGRPPAPPVLSVLPSCRETLLVFFRAA